MKLTFFQIPFKHSKNNVNEDSNIPIDAKNKIKQMTMEQGLYAQVVMLRLNDLNSIEANKNKNKDKFKFQGQSSRSHRCFDLGFVCI